MKERLKKLGYSIAGDLYNTADYGVPQQRRRAWVLAVLTAEMACSQPETLTKCIHSFRRWNVPLEMCLESSVGEGPQKHTSRSGEKWRNDFKEQCKIYGKAGWFNIQLKQR